MEKAYFNNIRSQIIPLLDNAKKEVVVAMAWFTSSELFHALIDCIKRGVHVEIVLLDNATNFMDYAPDFNILIESGGVLRIARVEDGFMHHKFCVIDDQIVITGSYNWTYYAETRNIENIVVSDNRDVIQQYREEFTSLANQTPKVSVSPRLEWEDIEECHNLNFDELNYEIENIAKIQNLPKKKVVKSSTIVTIEEHPLNPISKYDIGLKATVEGDANCMKTIIFAGTKLPYSSDIITFYNHADQRDNVICNVLYYDGTNTHSIAKKNITEITAGRNDWELTINIQFTLLQNGDLLAEIRCVETGKVIQVKSTKSDFIEYAK